MEALMGLALLAIGLGIALFREPDVREFFAKVLGVIVMIIAWLIGLAFALFLLFLIVRFIKFAWTA